MVRVRVWTPPPHEAEHCDHGEKMPEQSTGQPCVLQPRCSWRDGHCAPPFFGWTRIVRVRDCVPPLQVAEQEVHELQSDTTQSTGQSWVLHAWVSDVHGQVPPFFAGVITVRVRVCEPPPHVFEQVDHAP